MNGGLFGLKKSQKLFLDIQLVLPTFLVAFVLFKTNNALLTAVTYQIICTLCLPYIYIKLFSKEKEIRAYFFNELSNRIKQLTDGLQFFIGGFSIPFLSFVFYYEVRLKVLQEVHLPITHNPLYLLLLVITIGLVNPLVDEWLWRVFLPKTLPQDKKTTLLLNLCYALYHAVILYYCRGIYAALFAVSTYMSLAQSLLYIRENYGFITVLLCHYGINLALMLILADISFAIQAHPHLLTSSHKL